MTGPSSNSASTSSAGSPWTPRRAANSGHIGHGHGPRPPGPRAVHPGHAARPDRRRSGPNRDRFVLSNGHASILLYSMLYLTGYGLTLEDLKAFRQGREPHPRAPRAPPHRRRRGDDRPARPGGGQRGRHGGRRAGPAGPVLRPSCATTTPSSSAATAASKRASPTRRPRSPATSELGRLVYVYDDNHITIDGPTELAYSDNVPERFAAYGWDVDHIGEMANDTDALEAASGGPWPSRTSPPSSCCAATSAGRPRTSSTRPRPTATRSARRDPPHQGDPRPAARRVVLGPRRGRSSSTGAASRGARPCGPSGRPASTPGAATGRCGTRAWAGRGVRRLGGEAADLRGRQTTGHPPGHQRLPRRHRRRDPRARGRGGRPDREHRDDARGRRAAVGPSSPAVARSTSGSASTPWVRP